MNFSSFFFFLHSENIKRSFWVQFYFSETENKLQEMEELKKKFDDFKGTVVISGISVPQIHYSVAVNLIKY